VKSAFVRSTRRLVSTSGEGRRQRSRYRSWRRSARSDSEDLAARFPGTRQFGNRQGVSLGIELDWRAGEETPGVLPFKGRPNRETARGLELRLTTTEPDATAHDIERENRAANREGQDIEVSCADNLHNWINRLEASRTLGVHVAVNNLARWP